MFKEFKEFALKGNMVDLAIGVIIGAAFGAIVSSLVDDVFMPIIGLIIGGIDFSNLFIPLKNPGGVVVQSLAAAKAAGISTLNVGLFLNAIVKFAIIAFVLFLVVKGINSLKRRDPVPAPPPPPPPSREEALLAEIRDALRAQAAPRAATLATPRPATTIAANPVPMAPATATPAAVKKPAAKKPAPAKPAAK